MSSRNYDNEHSRGSQALLVAELRGREEGHQALLSQMKQEVGTLKNASLAEADLREKINADAMTQEETRKDLKKKLRTSQSDLDRSESQVDWLTQQMKKLQEVVNTLQAAQYFEDLETASASFSIHVPGEQFVFPRFFSKPRPSRDIFVTEFEQFTWPILSKRTPTLKLQPQQHHKPQQCQQALL